MLYQDNYNFWVNNPKIDTETKKELLKMNDNEKKEAFYKDLEFGTGGLRGIMGAGTNKVNIYTIKKATQGFANYLIANKLDSKGVAISYDNRFNSQKFAYEAAYVLAANNIKSFVFKDLRPTPMLSFAVRHFNAGGGIMITASHNPKEYNGYKAYNDEGAQLNLDQANQVINYINDIKSPFDIKSLKSASHITEINEDFDNIYLDLVKTIKINEPSKRIKIVYSPLHGTGGPVIPKFLKEMSYDVFPYEPQMIVDPNFSNTESSNPEEAKAYTKSIEYAKSINADIVLLTDPDADRLGIAVLNKGDYVLINGNQTTSMMAYYILDQKKKLNLLPNNGVIFTTIVSTDLIPVIAESFNVKVITTLTGFKFIGEQAELTKDKYEYLFGSEESYGSLVKPFVRDKDAVQAVYLLVEMASYAKDHGMTLVDYLETIYKKYGFYYEWTNNIVLSGIEGSERIKKITDYYRNNPLKLNDYQLLGYDDINSDVRFKKTENKLPKSNVLKFYFDNNLWVIFRPSGTEPKLKIYYGLRDSSNELAKLKIEKINKEILEQIDKL